MQWDMPWFPYLFFNLSDLAGGFCTGGMPKNRVSYSILLMTPTYWPRAIIGGLTFDP